MHITHYDIMLMYVCISYSIMYTFVLLIINKYHSTVISVVCHIYPCYTHTIEVCMVTIFYAYEYYILGYR